MSERGQELDTNEDLLAEYGYLLRRLNSRTDDEIKQKVRMARTNPAEALTDIKEEYSNNGKNKDDRFLLENIINILEQLQETKTN